MNPLAVALEAANAAGALLVEYLGRPIVAAEKGARGDLVTAADRASEALIVERLKRAYPDAAILAEEGIAASATDTAPPAPMRWIVDPLDGTTNFAHRYPLFCISIAFEVNGRLEAGVVYAPLLNETYAAERGSGATCNGAPISVSEVASVAEALVCTGFKPADFRRNERSFAALSNVAQGVRRDGAAALDLAFVAAGRFDAFWEFDLRAWDVAAGSLIVAEAGGRASAIDGSVLDLAAGSTLASNGLVHAEMIEVLASAR